MKDSHRGNGGGTQAVHGELPQSGVRAGVRWVDGDLNLTYLRGNESTYGALLTDFHLL